MSQPTPTLTTDSKYQLTCHQGLQQKKVGEFNSIPVTIADSNRGTFVNSPNNILDLNSSYSLSSAQTIATITDNIPLQYSREEHEFIDYFMNGGTVKSLNFSDLICLSAIYEFSTEELIELKHNTDFIKYLNENKIVAFSDLPKEVKQEPAIAIMAFNEGIYSFVEYIPYEYQTKEMFDRIPSLKFKDNPCLIQYMNIEFQSIELIKSVGFESFKFFNENVKTLEICELYLKKSVPVNFALIPEKFRDQLQQTFIEGIKKRRYYPSVEGLELLPISLLEKDPDIVIGACMINKTISDKIPSFLITNSILERIAKRGLSYIPQKYMTIDLVLLKINTGCFLKFDICIIEEYFKDYKEQIQEAALKHRDEEHFLQFIPDYITEQDCIEYIKHTTKSYHDLPDKYKTNMKIIHAQLEENFLHMHSLNHPDLTAENYQEIFENMPATPHWIKGVYWHYEFIMKKLSLLNTIPEEHRTLPIWLYLCNADREKIHQIPKQLFTKDALIFLINEYIKTNSNLDIKFIEYLFKHEFFDDTMRNKILQHSLQCAARSSNVLFTLLKSTKIPYCFKTDLLENTKSGRFFFEEATSKDLHSKTNPLRQIVPAKFATAFLSSCYRDYFSPARKIQFVLPAVTQSLVRYLDKSIIELPIDTTENIFTNPTIVGGRTIQVNLSATKAIFYKFRKPKEKLEDFVKEGHFLEFLNQQPEGKELRSSLKSDILTVEKMVRIPVDKLPKCALEFPDGLDITTDENGIKYADLLVFSGNKDYYHYAHKLDTENQQNRYAKSELGILKASHDIGIFTSQGIYHTSILPAYHDHSSKRQWTVLHMLLSNITISSDARGEIGYPRRRELFMVGRLDDWISATDKPDIASTGIRDLGDAEFFGTIKEPLKRFDCEHLQMFSAIQQNILAANTISEGLIAEAILYARLHFDSPSYHYKNESCIKVTAEFIEKIFSSFLSGRLQQEDINLQQFIGLSDADYQNVFLRIAKELIYWTQKPPQEQASSDIDLEDHINYHIKNRKLPEELYDHYDILDVPDFEIFYSPNDLGRENGTFPLLALTKLTYLLNIKLLEEHV